MMQMTFRLPEDLHARLKEFVALNEERDASMVIRQALRVYLDERMVKS
jgi:predicted transcriptional regulator